jgi:hypothetical protein
MILLIFIYIKVYVMVFHSPTPTGQEAPVTIPEARNLKNVAPQKAPKRPHYSDWRTLAVDLAGKLPAEVLKILRDEDPFGVRTFEKILLETESKRERFLEVEELRELFPCPTNRITLPDQRNSDKARAFRNGTEPYFLFFQHLRKAGGTNFCTLAEHNLNKASLPKYYCSAYSHFVLCVCVRLCVCVCSFILVASEIKENIMFSP